jgi:aminopeptidase YwaD
MQLSENHQVDRATASAALALTNTLLSEHPLRISGTQGCLAAGHAIAQLLRQSCDDVSEEPFELHPGSLWNVGKVMALSYLLSVVLFAAGGGFILAATVVCLLGLVYGRTHYVVCRNLFDRFFPPAGGCNVVGTIEPAGQVQQQVFVVGHHDAPYVLRFLQRFQALASIRLLLAIGFYVLYTFVCVAATVAYLSGADGGMLHTTGLIFALVGLAFVGPLYFVIARTPSPGAGDNLNASAIAIQVAQHFATRKQTDTPLQHTRLVLLSTDGEEVGQRGAIAYVKRHVAELSSIPSFVINIDSVYKRQDLVALTRDRNGTCPLSSLMAQECCQIAQALGYSLRAIALPFGGGSTDAAAFARRGIEATTIIGIPTTLIPRGLVYHTLEDTVAHIQPEAVQAVLDIIVSYVLRKDQRTATTR